jgi:hypothetical protein
MKLLDTIYESVILEYSQKLVNQLVDKFSEEGADSEDAKEYISLFKKYSQGLDLDKRDITKYSWQDLWDTVNDRLESKKRIKAGKIGDKNIDKDDVIYEKDGVVIYRGDSKEKCIRYGNGYNFCISSRGEDNKYDEYTHVTKNYYFIFNNNTEKFDPFRLVVIQKLLYPLTPNSSQYVLWDARNRQMFPSERLPSFDTIEILLPWLKGLEHIFE